MDRFETRIVRLPGELEEQRAFLNAEGSRGWHLVAVTTDHGHKPEGGHGEDETVVRRSFLLVHRLGGAVPAVVAEATTLRSHEVAPLLLAAVGVVPGEFRAGHPVGQVRDVASTGPTRDLRYEW